MGSVSYQGQIIILSGENLYQWVHVDGSCEQCFGGVIRCIKEQSVLQTLDAELTVFVVYTILGSK